MKAFSTTTYGKWILSGEHTVLRGGDALVFPLLSKSFQLNYDPSLSPDELEVILEGNHGPEFKALFRAVLDKALGLKSQKSDQVKGLFKISSQIPAGAGLGASAALCVAMTRWLINEGWVESSEQVEFARQLENIFHGESSGVDVAVVSAEKPLIYSRQNPVVALKTDWQPHLAISYTGSRGVTFDCVQKVKKLFETDRSLAENLDSQMKQSVNLAKQAFHIRDFNLLVQSIDLASDSFEKWGLTAGGVIEHIEKLRKAGAVATKPTGSGGGGFVLSLWKEPIQKIQAQLPELELMSCF